jgi:hypothetical protein
LDDDEDMGADELEISEDWATKPTGMLRFMGFAFGGANFLFNMGLRRVIDDDHPAGSWIIQNCMVWVLCGACY